LDGLFEHCEIILPKKNFAESDFTDEP